MAYEKYIKKDGKLYGPYIYHSRRINGKVVSEYHGQKQKQGNLFWIIPFTVLIILGAYFISQRSTGTGYAILDLNANYEEGQPISGNLKFSLREGELVPVESMVVFENQGSRYEYPLQELVSDQTTEGNFFVTGKELSGSGPGFGVAGEKTIYPKVNFVLLVYSKINETENLESEKEVSGTVSSENPFALVLQEGERGELKPRSVKTDSKGLNDGEINLETNGDELVVTTAYSEEEQGFGADYKGEKTKDLNIDLSGLNLILQKGDLNIAIVYSGEELVSLKTTVAGKEISAEKIIEETAPIEAATESAEETEILNTTAKNVSIEIPGAVLTEAERNILLEHFGDVSINVKEAKEKNGFIVVRYELGSFWVEYSYDSGLGNQTLQEFMEIDRTKWLKDIASGLLDSEEKEQQLGNFTGNYPIA